MLNIKETSSSAPVYSNPSLSDVQDYLYNTPEGHAPMIQQLLLAAFQKAEQVTGKSLAVHEYELELDSHDGEIQLLRSPINEVTKVECFDGTDWNTLETTDYTVKGLTEKVLMVSVSYQHLKITYTTSDGSNEVLKKLIKDLVQVWYDGKPDADNLEQIVVNRMAKFKVWQVE